VGPENREFTVDDADPRVCCSVYAPADVKPGSSFSVSVWVHPRPLTEHIASLAQMARPSLQRIATIRIQIVEGMPLTITLSMAGLDIVKSLTWHNQAEELEFGLTVPEEFSPGRVRGTATLTLDSQPVGLITLSLMVTALSDEASLQAAQCAMSDREFDRAIRLAKRVDTPLARRVRCAAIWGRAIVAAKEERYDSALNDLREALRLCEDRKECAVIQEQITGIERASAAARLQRAVEAGIGADGSAGLQRAIETGSRADAEEDLRRVLRQQDLPSKVTTDLKKRLSSVLNNRAAQLANEAAQRVGDRSPRPEASGSLSTATVATAVPETHSALERIDDAVRMLEEAVTLDPEDVEASRNLEAAKKLRLASAWEAAIAGRDARAPAPAGTPSAPRPHPRTMRLPGSPSRETPPEPPSGTGGSVRLLRGVHPDPQPDVEILRPQCFGETVLGALPEAIHRHTIRLQAPDTLAGGIEVRH